MPPIVRVQVSEAGLAGAISALLKNTRLEIGWSQAHLADRMAVSQAKVWRMESGRAGALDLHSIDLAFGALGLRASLDVEGRHLEVRREQRDLVHAQLVAVIAGRLRRAGWVVATEVKTGRKGPTGWIDILAFRASDGALLVIEVKTAVVDAGEILRQVTFYEREAIHAARREGWQPAVVRSALLFLDSADAASALTRNRDLLGPSFEGAPASLQAWLTTPGSPPPSERTLAMVDLARRRGPGLLRTPCSGRRSAYAFADYAAAARSSHGRIVGSGGPQGKAPEVTMTPPQGRSPPGPAGRLGVNSRGE
jgi:transcriptional regulator with XRE-family HTH domain